MILIFKKVPKKYKPIFLMSEHIITLINNVYPILVKFENEYKITLYIQNGISITFDIDLQWCRIHHHWKLIRAIDLEHYWHDPKTANQIIDIIKNLL